MTKQSDKENLNINQTKLNKKGLILLRRWPYKVTKNGSTSLCVSLNNKTFFEPGDKYFQVFDNKTGIVQLIPEEQFKKIYVKEV